MVDVRYVAAGLALVVLGASLAFVTPVGDVAGIEPVAFDDTLETGLTGVDVNQARARGYVIPRAQVFYSQYRYVVGYYGLESLVTGLDAATETGQFGRPVAIFVTDFSGTEPEVTPDGFVRLRRSTARSWVRAPAASYVIGGAARTPGGPAVLAFAQQSNARRFAADTGGDVVDWSTVRRRLATPGDSEESRLARHVREHTARADRAVEAATQLRDRPVSGRVAAGGPSLQAALDAAPPNTTIRVGPGRYPTNLTVDKPVTIRGAGAETVLDGDDTGSILTIRSPAVAVTNLRMTGIGDRRVGTATAANDGPWDERIRLVYGRGDAAIRLADANGSLVADVSIETPSNGIVALNSSDAVVRNVTVQGSETWQTGFMGVLAMYSDLVVEDSTFVGGRDGVYTHHAHGAIIRDNAMRSQRFGVHEMYTSDALVANNTVRATDVGLIVMTRPTGNVLVGNDVRDSEMGISMVGGASFGAENVIADNGVGLSIGTDRSVFTRNTIVHNEIGLRDDTLLPTNDVHANDVVANGRFVRMGAGSRSIWARNYWGPVPGRDRDGDGSLDRPFRPAAAVDAGAVTSAGARTLASSPALASLRQFQAAVPGLRGSSVVDPRPRLRPVRPPILERVRNPGGPTDR